MRWYRDLILLPLLLLAGGCGPGASSLPPLYGQHFGVPFTSRAPQRLRVGDLEPDGRGDLVTVDEGGGLSILWGDGPGHLSAPVALDTGTTGPVVDAVLTSLDLHPPGEVLALLPTQVVVLRYQSGHTLEVLPTGGHLAPGTGYRDLLVGDFNDDGHLDLFLVGDTGSDLWLGPDFKAALDPRPPALLPDPAPFVGGVHLWGGDDVVGMRQGPNGPELVALAGHGSGSFTVQVAPPLPSGDAITAIAPAKFAGDSFTDVLVGGKGFLADYPLTRDGVFGKPRLAKVEGLDPLALAAAHLGNGKETDIVATNRDGKLLTFLSQSFGVAEYVEAPPQVVGASPTGLAIAPIFGVTRGEVMQEPDIVVSTQGTCCPLENAGVHVFSGGTLTGSGGPTLSFNPAP